VDSDVLFAVVAPLFIAAIPVLVGTAIAVAGLVRVGRERRLREAGIPVTGVIVDNQMESGTSGRVSFAPVVSFRTADGREIKAVASQRSGRSYLTGTPVELRYDPDRPDRVLVDAPGAGARTAVAVGAAFAVFGLFIGAVFALFVASTGFGPA